MTHVLKSVLELEVCVKQCVEDNCAFGKYCLLAPFTREQMEWAGWNPSTIAVVSSMNAIDGDCYDVDHYMFGISKGFFGVTGNFDGSDPATHGRVPSSWMWIIYIYTYTYMCVYIYTYVYRLSPL